MAGDTQCNPLRLKKRDPKGERNARNEQAANELDRLSLSQLAKSVN